MNYKQFLQQARGREKNEILVKVFGMAQYFGGRDRNISKQCFSTGGKAARCKTDFLV